MTRRNQYHSFSASARSDRGGYFVRVTDRYWPGGDRPDYTPVMDLDPHEARALAESLALAAQEADVKNHQAKLMAEIRANTEAVAKAAKELAES